MKKELKQMYYEIGKTECERSFKNYGLDQIENDVIEFKSHLFLYRLLWRGEYFWKKGFIDKANEIFTKCYLTREIEPKEREMI